MFQFHSGSIKSRGGWYVVMAGRGFQFHSGSIKRGHPPDFLGILTRFQFHSGSIKSLGRRSRMGAACEVSIP